jgi:hypothetical protein
MYCREIVETVPRWKIICRRPPIDFQTELCNRVSVPRAHGFVGHQHDTPGQTPCREIS